LRSPRRTVTFRVTIVLAHLAWYPTFEACDVGDESDRPPPPPPGDGQRKNFWDWLFNRRGRDAEGRPVPQEDGQQGGGQDGQGGDTN